jgi:hypothetical protein
MAVLVTTDPAVFRDIDCTPDLEDGIGPVMMGTPIAEAEGVPNRRYAVCHPWPLEGIDEAGDPVGGVDVAWAWAYAYSAIQVLPELPADWRYPEAGA